MDEAISNEDLKIATELLAAVDRVSPWTVDSSRAYAMALVLAEFRADILQNVLRMFNARGI